MKSRRRVTNRANLYFQVGLMVLAFLLVAGLMGVLESPLVKSQIGFLLGVFRPASLVHQDRAWQWCPPQLSQLRYLPTQTLIDDPSMLADLCSIPIEASTTEEIGRAKFHPLLRTEASDRTALVVEASNLPDLFRIGGLAFRSKPFREKLQRFSATPAKSTETPPRILDKNLGS